ncbi:MAG: hypothetical protein LIO67_05580 [Lachnospiraceae bacterium]|nr:hypothetical protein [Lachnospiraceae bacterium]
MKELLIGIVNILSEGIVAIIRSFISAVLTVITTAILSPFTFATTAQVESHFGGIYMFHEALISIGFGIAILLVLWNILRYMWMPDSQTESAGMILVRFFMALFLTYYSSSVIDYVLLYGNKFYQVILGAEIDQNSFSEQIENLFSLDVSRVLNIAENTWISVSVVGLVILIVLALILVWNFIKLWFQLFERFANFVVELYLCPLAFCALASNTACPVFFCWLRCIISQFALLIMNVWFVKVFLYSFTIGTGMSLVGTTDNLLIYCMFQIAFLKVAQNAEQILNNWGLMALSSGRITGDLGEMMSAYRSATQLITGRIAGFGGSGGAAAGGFSGVGGLKGFMSSHGLPKGFTGKGVPGRAVRAAGGIIGGIKGVVTRNGFANGWRSGSEKVNSGIQKANQKIADIARENPRAARAAAGAGIGGAAAGPVGAGIGAVAGGITGRRKVAASVATASDIRNAEQRMEVASSHSAQDQAKRYLSGIDTTGKMINRKEKVPQFNNLSEPKATSYGDDPEKSARSLFGDNLLRNAQIQGLGSCVGVSYNAATGHGTASFEKTGFDGKVQRTNVDAYALTGKPNYQKAHSIAESSHGSETFVQSQGAEGTEYVCYIGKTPQAIREQEEVYKRENSIYVPDEEVRDEVCAEIAKGNAAYVDDPVNERQFLAFDEEGEYIGPSRELQKYGSAAYEAMEDWIREKGIHTADDSPHNYADAYWWNKTGGDPEDFPFGDKQEPEAPDGGEEDL